MPLGSPILSGVPRDEMTSRSRTIMTLRRARQRGRTLAGRENRKDALLALVGLGLVLPHAHDGAALQLTVVHDVVRLGGQDALHEVFGVAEHDAVPLSGGALALEGLDMEALHHRDGELGSGAVWVEEYRPDPVSDGVSSAQRTQASCTYSIAPFVICCSAILPCWWYLSLCDGRQHGVDAG